MRKLLTITTAALLVASAAQAQTRGGITFERHQEGPANAPESGFPSGAEWTHNGPGADFIQASWSTRTAGIGAPVTCPFTLNVPAPPAGSTVVDTIVSWTYLSNDTPPTDPISINGTPVVGAMLGFGAPDLCWGKGFGVTYMISGATSLVNIGGANTIDGVCDGPVGTDGSALGEGITIIVIYEDAADPTTRTVDVFAGYTSSTSSTTGTAKATLDLSCTYDGGPFHFFVNADDGQDNGSDLFFINGIDVSGIVAGTYIAGDAWAGLVGPSATNNLYDAADDDIQAFVSVGDTSVDIESGFGGDCVAHSLAACSYEPDDNCSGCSVIPYCNPFTGSFNNTATITPNACDLGNPIVLTMNQAPAGELTYLCLGNGSGLIVDPPGATGDLCIASGGMVARYDKDVGAIDGGGSFSTDISNSVTGGPGFGIPLYGGSIQAGETWYFQFWYRNTGAPSGFSEAVCITFQ